MPGTCSQDRSCWGLVLIALGLAMALLAPRLDESVLVPAGWAVVGVAALLMLTFRADGLIVGMGSKASTAAVLAAAGLALAGRRRVELTGRRPAAAIYRLMR